MTNEAGPVRLNSVVDNLTQLGPEFMKTVFGMDIGDVTVAVNHPQNTVYLVRIASLDPNEQTLQERFTRALPDSLRDAARFDLETRREALNESLRKEFQLEWKRRDEAEASN